MQPFFVEKYIESFEWVPISSGKTNIIRVDTDTNKQQKSLYVPEFSILRYPVTNWQYQFFLDAENGYANPSWWNYSVDALKYLNHHPTPYSSLFPADELPRTLVSWYGSIAFCAWLSDLIAKKVSLPSEGQWQRAAHGETITNYPWGNIFDDNKCVFHKSEPKRVKDDINGSSPYAVMGLSGNVWEWCIDSEDSYPEPHHKITKGGSHQEYDPIQLQIDHYSVCYMDGACDVGIRPVLIA